MLRKFVGKTDRALQQGLLFILKGYQFFVSPQLGRCCRFYPSCSQYAIEALSHFPCYKAAWLILKRILRCHPFHPGGYDPINASGLHGTTRPNSSLIRSK